MNKICGTIEKIYCRFINFGVIFSHKWRLAYDYDAAGRCGFLVGCSRRSVEKGERTRLSPAAIQGLLRIAKHWRLRDEDTRVLLGGRSSGSFYTLKNQATKTLDGDQLTRISLLGLRPAPLAA